MAAHLPTYLDVSISLEDLGGSTFPTYLDGSTSLRYHDGSTSLEYLGLPWDVILTGAEQRITLAIHTRQMHQHIGMQIHFPTFGNRTFHTPSNLY